MFDIQPTELLVLGVVAILVIPPKDLPKAMRIAGHWMGKARGVARQFRSGFDEMIREAELAEMEKKWREENARIMAEHPPTPAMLEGPVDARAASAGATLGDTDDDAARSSQLDSDPRQGDDDEDTPVMVEKPIVAPAEPPGQPAEPDLFGDLQPPRDSARL